MSQIPMEIHGLEINGKKLDIQKPLQVKSGTLMSYFRTSENELVAIELQVNKDQLINVDILEAKYDLLTNSQFQIEPRGDDMIPMPFVLNDATVITSNLKF